MNAGFVCDALGQPSKKCATAREHEALANNVCGKFGLRAILEEVLLNTMYELPGRTDIERVVVDVDAVVEKASPTLVPRTARVARQRRAAS